MNQCIFISYRREDASGHAGRLQDGLVARFGIDQVFMDLNMEPGIDFVDQLEAAVGSCAVLLVLIGKSWLDVRDSHGRRRLDNERDYVRSEVASALARDIRVIPVLVGDAEMPTENLPIDLLPLTRRNAFELSDERWTHDMTRLIGTLERFVGDAAGAGTPLTAPPPPVQAPARPVERRAPATSARRLPVRLIAGASVAAAGAIAAIAIASGGSGQPMLSLTVANGPQAGYVEIRPANDPCHTTCHRPFAADTPVTLVQHANPGWRFDGWDAGCAGAATSTSCRLTMDGSKSTTAKFTRAGGRYKPPAGPSTPPPAVPPPPATVPTTTEPPSEPGTVTGTGTVDLQPVTTQP